MKIKRKEKHTKAIAVCEDPRHQFFNDKFKNEVLEIIWPEKLRTEEFGAYLKSIYHKVEFDPVAGHFIIDLGEFSEIQSIPAGSCFDGFYSNHRLKSPDETAALIGAGECRLLELKSSGSASSTRAARFLWQRLDVLTHALSDEGSVTEVQFSKARVRVQLHLVPGT
jgi:hypothetical protein